MPVAVLAVICLICAALLGAVNMITAPEIEKAESQKVYDSLRRVIDGDFTPAEIPEGASSDITAIYKVTSGETLVGHAVTLSAKGYAGQILLTVGIDAEGKVTKAVITSQSESHGKAGMATYTDKFEGVGSDAIAGVETFTGATISSTAIKGAIINALNAVTGGSIEAPPASGEPKPPMASPKTDAEVLTLAGELVSGAEGFEDVTPTYNKPESLMKLYKETSDKGYVAYIATPGQYVPVANEGLVHIDLNGDIVGIKHLTWVVGNNISNEGFADKFLGKDLWHVGEVELITQATVTSGDFLAAVEIALDTVTKMIVRTDEKLLELVDEIVPNSKGFELLELPEGAPETLKRVYKETSDKGYVAYIVTAGEYVAVATESLVYLDGEGNIKDMEILVWNVGHGIGPGDFTDRFIGKNAETVKDVELVTAATGTSGDLKAAVEAALPYIPTDFPIARVIGIIALVLAVAAPVGFGVYLYIKRRKRV